MLLIIFKRINQWVALLRTSWVAKTALFSPTRFVWLTHTSSGSFTIQLRTPVYVPKKRTEFYIQHKTPTYGFVYGNYKPRGYTSRKRKKKYFARICSVLGPLVLAQTEGPKNSYNLHSLPLIGPALRVPFYSTWRKTDENALVCFCPKMPRTNVHCLTPSPVNVQLTLSEGKVNMSTAPNIIFI